DLAPRLLALAQALSVTERQLHGSLLNMRRVVSRICGALFRASLSEQLSISSYLADTIELHERCVLRIEASVKNLNEVRSALITAAVTGQLPELNG
ncbi:hypothetical protein V2H26_11265, partial [Xanthomonas euvesicatoria]|nr:hypothetical protein [Xanthomonas euvesicatoria]